MSWNFVEVEFSELVIGLTYDYVVHLNKPKLESGSVGERAFCVIESEDMIELLNVGVCKVVMLPARC